MLLYMLRFSIMIDLSYYTLSELQELVIQDSTNSLLKLSKELITESLIIEIQSHTYHFKLKDLFMNPQKSFTMKNIIKIFTQFAEILMKILTVLINSFLTLPQEKISLIQMITCGIWALTCLPPLKSADRKSVV